MYLSPLEFLRHIDDELVFLIRESTTVNEERFSRDEVLQRAFVRSLEIIGEASKKINNNFKLTYSDVEWSDMCKMRDKLIHHYFGVDYQIVWQVVSEDIPLLHIKISEIIESEEFKNQ